jgi:DUF4097 and DUF4098 domain-containing protein YvlB
MRILLVCILAAVAARADDWSKRFEITGRPELRVEADDAAVILKAGAGNAVEARLTTHGWSIGPNGVRVTTHQNGNRVEIEVRVPNRNWNFGSRSARLEVSVPAELRAEVRTGDGNVSAHALKGEFRLTTGDGGIEAESLDGTLTVRSGDGGVNVRGRFDQLDVRTDDGSVSASLDPGSKMNGPWRFESGDGNVTLRIPEGFAADLDAHTGDGEITVRLPVTTTGFKSSPSDFRGKLNGGGLPLRIHTGDGSIRIERL